MTMANSFLPALLLSTLFYLIIPGVGAFNVRSRWRKFRRDLVAASLYPRVETLRLRRDPAADESARKGEFRLFGSLEAMQGDDIIWLRSGSLSVSAEMAAADLYMLPAGSMTEEEERQERNEDAFPDEMPRKLSWDRVFSLPEGTRMFLAGPLFRERGQLVFRADEHAPLTVVLYEGREDTLLRRAIWGGRQRNELWNDLTPGSLVAGSFSLLILTYILFRTPLLRLPALFSLTLSLLPLLPLFPPFVPLFFLYRSLWRKARSHRAERDLLLLPLRYFPDEQVPPGSVTRLPDGGSYIMQEVVPGREDAPVYGNIRVRSTTLLRKEDGRSVLFGSPLPGEDGAVGKPADPMADFVLIPGNPQKLSALCRRRAVFLERTAAAAFAAGLLFNVYLVFIGLSVLIRYNRPRSPASGHG